MSEVQFRRIRGRIVPIKMSKRQKRDAKQGAGFLVAGIGVGVGSGAGYRAVNRAAVHKSAKAFRSIEKVYQRMSPTLSSHARKAKVEAGRFQQLKDAKRLQRMASPLRLLGTAASAVLIGVGAAKLKRSQDGQSSADLTKAYAFGSAASIGAFAVGSYRGAGVRMAVKSTYKRLYPTIRKYKSKLKL